MRAGGDAARLIALTRRPAADCIAAVVPVVPVVSVVTSGERRARVDEQTVHFGGSDGLDRHTRAQLTETRHTETADRHRQPPNTYHHPTGTR